MKLNLTASLTAALIAGAAFPVLAKNTTSLDQQQKDVATSPVGLTAGDQSTKPADVEITRQIRQELMKKDLSTQAKNITIITTDGVVTLKGEVASANEKSTIEKVALSHAGNLNVRNQIAVKR